MNGILEGKFIKISKESIGHVFTFPYIKDHRDWYSVSIHQIKKCGGNGLFYHHHGSLSRALISAFPHLEFHPWRFSVPHQITRGKSYFSKDQQFLYRQLQELFPSYALQFNFKYSDRNKIKRRIVEFDISKLFPRKFLRKRYLFLSFLWHLSIMVNNIINSCQCISPVITTMI